MILQNKLIVLVSRTKLTLSLLNLLSFLLTVPATQLKTEGGFWCIIPNKKLHLLLKNKSKISQETEKTEHIQLFIRIYYMIKLWFQICPQLLTLDISKHSEHLVKLFKCKFHDTMCNCRRIKSNRIYFGMDKSSSKT